MKKSARLKKERLSKKSASAKSLKGAQPHTIHFIGIGGIGISALAQYYAAAGASVSGSDLFESDTIRTLREKGAGIVTGIHVAGNIPKETNSVVISNAITPQNEELRAAKRRHIPIRTYPEALGRLMKKRAVIAVCGAHGKSTVTALSALIMEKAGLDPLVFVGTKLHEWQGANFRMGAGPYALLEADEYKEAFLQYAPTIAIATNIDKEHLDHYQTLENIQKAFRKFLSKIPPQGVCILNKDDEYLRHIGKKLHEKGKKVLWYSLHSPLAQSVKKSLKIPGSHNVSNALAALSLAKYLKIPEEIAFEVLKAFRGSWRRAEYKGTAWGARIYDDYAHHPTEIRATLAGFREQYPLARIWCVFQPHQKKRLELLFDDFARSFRCADNVVLLETYHVPGRDDETRQTKKQKIKKTEELRAKTSFELARAIDERGRKPVFYLRHVNEVKRLLEERAFDGDVIIMMGAGDINELTKHIVHDSIS